MLESLIFTDPSWTTPTTFSETALLLGLYFFKQIESLTINTPGNVVRGSQSYVNRMGASDYCLQTVHRMSTNVLTCYSLSTQKENRQLGNVVLNTFHFYTKLNRNSRGKTSGQRLI